VLINGEERGCGDGGLDPVGESMSPKGSVRCDKASLEPQDEAGQARYRQGGGEESVSRKVFFIFNFNLNFSKCFFFLSFIISTKAFLDNEQASFAVNNHATTTS
jgi:hypothetical protein